MRSRHSNILNGPGVDESRPKQSRFSPVQCGINLNWNRISLTFHQTGLDSVWTGPGFHCRVRFKLAGIELIMG